MYKRRLIIALASTTTCILIGTLICGCGGGSGTGSMMLKIKSPASGTTCAGNTTITATMLNPAMATSVDFRVNGESFATVAPAPTMTVNLDTLSRGLANGPATITVVTAGNTYTASTTININNSRSIYVQDVSGSVDGTVTVHVKLNNYANAAGYHIFLGFDSTKLALSAASVAKGAGVPAASVLTTNTSTPGRLEASVDGAGAFTSGDILVANFQIKRPSAHGTRNSITIDASPSLVDTSGHTLDVTGVTGYVTTN